MTNEILSTTRNATSSLVEGTTNNGKGYNKKITRLLIDEGVPVAIETGAYLHQGKLHYGVVAGQAIVRRETQMSNPAIDAATKPVTDQIFILHLFSPPFGLLEGSQFISFLNVGLLESADAITLPCGAGGANVTLPLFHHASNFTPRDYSAQIEHKRANSWVTTEAGAGISKAKFTFGPPDRGVGLNLEAIGLGEG